LRTRAIPERLRGEITTRLYTKPIIPLPLPLRISLVFLMLSWELLLKNDGSTVKKYYDRPDKNEH